MTVLSKETKKYCGMLSVKKNKHVWCRLFFSGTGPFLASRNENMSEWREIVANLSKVPQWSTKLWDWSEVKKFEPGHSISYKVACMPSEG